MPYTLNHPVQITKEIKKSRFIVNASPITLVEQAEDFIKQISQSDATHNCWAWKLGQKYRFNDDGEPSGTAGRPILSAIEGQDCDQVVVIVTRYFGGIKLGAGGLIRAYGSSASHCLQQAPLIPIIHRQQCYCHCLYSEWSMIENRILEYQIIIEKSHFDDTGVDLKLAITQEMIVPFANFLTHLTRGREKLKTNP